MKNMVKRAISFTTSLIMAFSLMLMMPMNVFAQTEAFVITGGVRGTDYTYTSGILTIKTTTPITVKNADPTVPTTDNIVVSSGVDATVTLAGVNIATTKAAFSLGTDNKAQVTIIVADGTDNILQSGSGYAGIAKSRNESTRISTLNYLYIIGDTKSTGTLTAIGGNGAAGIGGNSDKHSGKIAIKNTNVVAISGKVPSNSYSPAAGIGGGGYGSCDYISISNSNVTANGVSSGIGGGYNGKAVDIRITDSKVIATSSSGGSGIGGGYGQPGSAIYITNSTVEATGYSTGIGGGYNNAGYNIIISNSKVTAKSTGDGAGIGGSYNNIGRDIVIKDDSYVVATGSRGAAGIGGGCESHAQNVAVKSGDGYNITILDSTVIATGGNGFETISSWCNGGSGIGGGYGRIGYAITITNSNVTANGGLSYDENNRSLGIGGATITDSVITANGGIGESDQTVYIEGGSVKSTDGKNPEKLSIEANVKDTNEKNLHLLVIENANDEDIVINNEVYPSTHGEEKRIYVYLVSGKDHEVTVGGKTTTYRYCTDRFLIVPTASLFEFEAPTDLTYSGEALTIPTDIVNANVDGMGEILDVRFYHESNTETNVDQVVLSGKYTVEIDVSQGELYTSVTSLTSPDWFFEVDKAIPKIEPPVLAENLVYDGLEHNLIVSGATNDGEILYSLEKEGVYTSNIPVGKDATVYNVWYKVIGKDNYTNIEPCLIEVAIMPKPVTVVAKNAEKIFGQTDPESLSYTVEGIIDNEILVGKLVREDGENVGSYAIKQGSLTNENNTNYDITFVGAVFEIDKAVALDVTTPEATEIYYGQTLDASSLSDSDWKWESGNQVPFGSGEFKAYIEVIDYENYDYSDVLGYDENSHTIVRDITVNVNKVIPEISVVATPNKDIPNKNISVIVTIKNPYNSELTDLPEVILTYKVGDNEPVEFTDSFVIPEGTAENTVITITAMTNANNQYIASVTNTTISVINCTHNGTTELEFDDTSHWYHCSYCNKDIEIENHFGGEATCVSLAKCEVCLEEYGEISSNNHINVNEEYTIGDQTHWHDCECGNHIDEREHYIYSGPTLSAPGVCECQKQMTNCLGDVNGDKTTGIRDVVLLYQYISNWEIDINTQLSDINADGIVNIRDVVLLYQYYSRNNRL